MNKEADTMRKPKIKETACTACGMLGSPAEYHPMAYCLLARQVGSKAARANINAVIDYGRMLERFGLPNDAPITATLRASPHRRPTR
jgi:hypothetical protein